MELASLVVQWQSTRSYSFLSCGQASKVFCSLWNCVLVQLKDDSTSVVTIDVAGARVKDQV